MDDRISITAVLVAFLVAFFLGWLFFKFIFTI